MFITVNIPQDLFETYINQSVELNFPYIKKEEITNDFQIQRKNVHRIQEN